MWCHNALQEHFEPVWVVLTDLSKVCVLAHGTDPPTIEAAQTHCGSGRASAWLDCSSCSCADTHPHDALCCKSSCGMRMDRQRHSVTADMCFQKKSHLRCCSACVCVCRTGAACHL